MTQQSLLNEVIFTHNRVNSKNVLLKFKSILKFDLNYLSCFERLATCIWQRIFVPHASLSLLIFFLLLSTTAGTNFDRIRSSNLQKEIISLCLYAIVVLFFLLHHHNLDVISQHLGQLQS